MLPGVLGTLPTSSDINRLSYVPTVDCLQQPSDKSTDSKDLVKYLMSYHRAPCWPRLSIRRTWDRS